MAGWKKDFLQGGKKKYSKYGKYKYSGLRSGNFYKNIHAGAKMLFNTGQIESPLPNTLCTTLKYCTSKVLSVSSVPQTWSFKANSLYDPDYTGVGHQPMGYDQLMAAYNKWVVVASKAKVTFLPNESNGTHNALVGVHLAEVGSTFPTTYEQAMEITPHWRVLSTDNGLSGVDPITCKSKYNAKKYWHLKDLMDNDELFGQVTTDLEERRCAYYDVWVAHDDTTEIADVRFYIEIDYTVVFAEPRTLTTS